MKKIMLFLLLFLLAIGTASAEDELSAVRTADRSLEWLRLYLGGEMKPQEHTLYLIEDQYYLYNGEGLPVKADVAAAEKLVRIMEEYDVFSWDGFVGEQTEFEILDGEVFSLDAAFSNGESVHASGDNVFPPNYSPAFGTLFEVMENAAGEEIKPIPGTYTYENEGFGGHFTITINADETYTFYEGPLSSYAGGGEWLQEGVMLILIEENGLSLFNNFVIGEDVLIFAEADSDNFPHITVPDAGKFIKTAE